MQLTDSAGRRETSLRESPSKSFHHTPRRVPSVNLPVQGSSSLNPAQRSLFENLCSTSPGSRFVDPEWSLWLNSSVANVSRARPTTRFIGRTLPPHGLGRTGPQRCFEPCSRSFVSL